MRPITHAAIIGISGVVLAMPIPSVAQPSRATANQHTAMQAEQAFAQAVAKTDPAAVSVLLDTDFTWTDADGKTVTRAEVLKSLPKTLLDYGGRPSASSERNYGQVEMIQRHQGRDHALNIWVHRSAGWRLLVHQEVRLMDTEPVTTPGAGGECINPCETLPYQPKSESERQAVTAYMGLQAATVARDSAKWGTFVADEFTAANSNSNKVLNKHGRMEDLERNKMAGYSPMPVVKMQVFDFGNSAVLITDHQPEHGKPVHITRMWIERDGHWMEAASYQTRIQAAPAKP